MTDTALLRYMAKLSAQSTFAVDASILVSAEMETPLDYSQCIVKPKRRVYDSAPSTIWDRSDWPPDYTQVFAWRQRKLDRLRRDPDLLAGAKEFYRTHPAEFVNHWAVTYDPRNAGSERTTLLPFILFGRQEELIRFIHEACLIPQENGLVEKSREMGATWVCAAFSDWLWRFHPGSSIGWGSRKEQLVDKIGNPDSIFQKIRMLNQYIPNVFQPKGFNAREHSTYMRVLNPENGSTITGEGGDNIGRGGRKTIFFVDEAAHVEHPELVEAALSENTRCQIAISSVGPPGNVFNRRREAGIDWSPGKHIEKGRTRVFVMDWRDHPEKNAEWYRLKRDRYESEGLLHVVARELDRDYSASVQGVIIPSPWVNAAIDAHEKLEFDDSGPWVAALDVADDTTAPGEQMTSSLGDMNALALRKGVVLKYVEEWGERDTGVTTRRAVKACEGRGVIELQYDCVGVGAGVKSEANRLLDDNLMPREIRLVPWLAGGAVADPDKHLLRNADGSVDRKSPLCKDFFQNFRAQAWWSVRDRFYRTWRAIEAKEGRVQPGESTLKWSPEDLISIDSQSVPTQYMRKLIKELSQPTWGTSGAMKTTVNKKPSGTRSPNLADAVIMAFFPRRGSRAIEVPHGLADRLRLQMRSMR